MNDKFDVGVCFSVVGLKSEGVVTNGTFLMKLEWLRALKTIIKGISLLSSMSKSSRNTFART